MSAIYFQEERREERKCKIRTVPFVVVVVVLVELTLLLRLTLWAWKYWPVDYLHPEEVNETQTGYDYTQCKTFGFISALSSLTCFEYLLLGCGFYKQIKWNTRDNIPVSTVCGYFFISALVLCPLGLLGLIKAGLSVAMEVKKEPNMIDVNNVTYIVYCICELCSVMFAYIVRIMMLMTTLRIRHVWKKKSEITSGKDIEGLDATKEAINSHYAELHEYKKRGEQAEYLMYPYKVWFLIPWIIYYIYTLIDPHDILSPWKEGTEDAFILSRFFYLTYLILKSSQLLTQYACALKMNQYHNEYYDGMRDRHIFQYTDKEYQTKASQFGIDYKEKYNFHPNFLQINPRISISNPLFMLTLLVAIFLRVSNLL